MSFVLKIRGAVGTPMLAEYWCQYHGRFDATVQRDDKGDPPASQKCGCGADSEHVISRTNHKTCWATAAVKGSNDDQPSPYHMDTEALADGMDETEWRAGRDKVWENWREKEIRKTVTV